MFTKALTKFLELLLFHDLSASTDQERGYQGIQKLFKRKKRENFKFKIFFFFLIKKKVRYSKTFPIIAYVIIIPF